MGNNLRCDSWGHRVVSKEKLTGGEVEMRHINYANEDVSRWKNEVLRLLEKAKREAEECKIGDMLGSLVAAAIARAHKPEAHSRDEMLEIGRISDELVYASNRIESEIPKILKEKCSCKVSPAI